MTRYFQPSKVDVEIPAIRFNVPIELVLGFPKKGVDCVAKGPFIADFVWDLDSEGYYCDRLYLKRGMVRLDDVPGFKHLLDGAANWANENNIGKDQWETL